MCFPENENLSPRALKALKANFVAILSMGERVRKVRSWVRVHDEH